MNWVKLSVKFKSRYTTQMRKHWDIVKNKNEYVTKGNLWLINDYLIKLTLVNI